MRLFPIKDLLLKKKGLTNKCNFLDVVLYRHNELITTSFRNYIYDTVN
jgi:hypothetical protein